MNRIEGNLAEVRATIARSAEKVGRDPDEVKLVCVTKMVGLAEIEELCRLGERRLGENRIQDARKKIVQVPALDVDWHLIGHLQTNKVKLALELFRMIHSVDTLRLAQEISRRAEMLETRVPVLLEVNVSGEASKYGVPVEGRPASGQEPEPVAGVFDLAPLVAALPGVDLRGLMTMAPYESDPEATRPVFRRLRQLRDEINSRSLVARPLEELSMGMTNDYPVAVEEGATWVRIGSALFQ